MDLKFSMDELIKAADNMVHYGELQILSMAPDVSEDEFSNVVQIIDESGNEMNCTFDKFIEIFDNNGLEGFIL